MANERREFGGLVGPVILIGVGLLLLLANFGVIDWNVWAFLARFWPVALIAVGVDILLGGRARGAIVAAALIAVAALWVGWGTPLSAGAEPETVVVSQELEGASRAELRLSPGVARLDLGAVDDADLLISGTVASGRGETIDQDFQRSGELASYSIRSRGEGMSFFSDNGSRKWELEASREVPLDLIVDAGVGRIELDLSELQIAGLSLNLGVGDTRVILPDAGNFEASIDAGVGEVTVRIPRGMAASIRADRGVGSVNVSGDYQRVSEDVFASADFEEAEDRVDLRLDGGVGSIDIETY